ncbi:MAG: hypothetical protein AAFP70_13190, partial [Calditrichota bacterium]
ALGTMEYDTNVVCSSSERCFAIRHIAYLTRSLFKQYRTFTLHTYAVLTTHITERLCTSLSSKFRT